MTTARTPPGRDKRFCGADTRTGGTCRRPAGWGTDHPRFGRCKLHGGSTPSHRAAAVAESVQADAAAVLVRLGVTPVDDPLEELAKLAAQTRALVDALAARVNALDSVRFTDSRGAEQIRAEMVLFERAQDRLGRMLAYLSRLGLLGRRALVDEQLAETFAALIDAILGDLDLSPAQRVAARRVVPARLLEVVGG